MPTNIRMLLIGAPGGEFRRAAEMARDAGADVAMADTPDEALAMLRDAGGDLVMIDVEADVPRFMASVRAERFSIPVLACGINAPAQRAVAAIRAGARDYVPLPPAARADRRGDRLGRREPRAGAAERASRAGPRTGARHRDRAERRAGAGRRRKGQRQGGDGARDPRGIGASRSVAGRRVRRRGVRRARIRTVRP